MRISQNSDLFMFFSFFFHLIYFNVSFLLSFFPFPLFILLCPVLLPTLLYVTSHDSCYPIGCEILHVLAILYRSLQWTDFIWIKSIVCLCLQDPFGAVQSHNVTWCQKAVRILAFVWLTSFERQPWPTASLASDWSMPADPPNEGGQPVQAAQALIFTSNVPVPPKIELSGNLANNWKQWKQVWSAYELVTRLNEQTDEYRVAAFITCIGPKALTIHNGLPFQCEDEKKNLAKILELWESYCLGKTNIIYERYRFNNRNQEAGESIDT